MHVVYVLSCTAARPLLLLSRSAEGTGFSRSVIAKTWGVPDWFTGIVGGARYFRLQYTEGSSAHTLAEVKRKRSMPAFSIQYYTTDYKPSYQRCQQWLKDAKTGTISKKVLLCEGCFLLLGVEASLSAGDLSDECTHVGCTWH